MKRETLEKIQELMIEDMKKRLEEGDCSAQEWTTIAKFLKDNDVVVPAEDSNELKKLREDMERRRNRRLTAEERAEVVVPLRREG